MKYIISALFVFGCAYANAGLKVGDPAPCLSLKTVNSAGVSTMTSTCQSQASGKKLVLDFFATWCHYCVENLPVFEAMAAAHGDVAEFRIMGLDEKAKPLEDFFKVRDTSKYQVVYDQQNVSVDPFAVEGTPTTVVIGSDGKVKLIHLGTIESAQERKSVEDAITK